jgi:hypothetical protein
MTAFWDIVSCSPVQAYLCFRGAYCPHHQGDKTSVYFNETTWRYVPESCHLHIFSLFNDAFSETQDYKASNANVVS